MAIAGRPALGILLALALMGCATKPGSGNTAVPRLTVAELAEKPSSYHDRTIEVWGLASSRPDRNRLYGSIHDLCVPGKDLSYVHSDYRNPDLPPAYDRHGIFRGRFIASNRPPPSGEAGTNVPGTLKDAQLVEWTSGFISACF